MVPSPSGRNDISNYVVSDKYVVLEKWMRSEYDGITTGLATGTVVLASEEALVGCYVLALTYGSSIQIGNYLYLLVRAKDIVLWQPPEMMECNNNNNK